MGDKSTSVSAKDKEAALRSSAALRRAEDIVNRMENEQIAPPPYTQSAVPRAPPPRPPRPPGSKVYTCGLCHHDKQDYTEWRHAHLLHACPKNENGAPVPCPAKASGNLDHCPSRRLKLHPDIAARMKRDKILSKEIAKKASGRQRVSKKKGHPDHLFNDDANANTSLSAAGDKKKLSILNNINT
jgi:hypothetical protein